MFQVHKKWILSLTPYQQSEDVRKHEKKKAPDK